MATNIQAGQNVDLHFPKAGLDVSTAAMAQPPRQLPDGSWARTCPIGVNVRSFEGLTNRSRGGSRPGLARHVATPLVAGWIVQQLDTITRTAESGMTQTSQSGRIVTLVAVSQGDVYTAKAGDTAWTAAVNNTGNTPPLNFTGLMYSSHLNQKLYFADGINWVVYTPGTNSLDTWAATAGTLPVDTDSNKPRLIATWRGRIILSGLILDPQDVFMSAVDDATNFDYSPLSQTPTQAVALNTGPQGVVGDVVTALVPFTDDVLIIGGDHTIWMLRGDPMDGGQLDLVTSAVGFAWGQAWCQDPYGNIYFVSNRCGVYMMTPGQKPQRISQAIERPLQQLDTGEKVFRLIWDDQFQGLHLFITTAAEPTTSDRHFFFEQRTGAWWEDAFDDENMNPLCCVTFDGNRPEDRVPLIGSWDGYVRAVRADATDDDGAAIDSEVWIGPILTKFLDDVMLNDVQAVMGEGSGEVTWEVYIASSAEAALAMTTPVASGSWSSGRNFNSLVRWAGHAVYIRIRSTNVWAMESLRARFGSQGKVRGRDGR